MFLFFSQCICFLSEGQCGYAKCVTAKQPVSLA